MIGTCVAEDESLEARLEREALYHEEQARLLREMLKFYQQKSPQQTFKYAGKTPGEAARQLLRETGKPLSYSEIARDLIDNGAMHGKSYPEEQVFKALDYQVKAGGLKPVNFKKPLIGRLPRAKHEAEEFMRKRREQVVTLP